MAEQAQRGCENELPSVACWIPELTSGRLLHGTAVSVPSNVIKTRSQKRKETHETRQGVPQNFQKMKKLHA